MKIAVEHVSHKMHMRTYKPVSGDNIGRPVTTSANKGTEGKKVDVMEPCITPAKKDADMEHAARRVSICTAVLVM